MRLLVIILPTVVIAACGGNPAAPGGARQNPRDSQPPLSLRIVADPVIDLAPGQSRALEISETDQAGQLVSRSVASYTWTSSDSNTVSVDQAGVIRPGPQLGQAVITARSPAGLQATVRVWVQQPESIPSAFQITLVYGDGVPESWHGRFRWAADRWQYAIRASLPPTTVGATSQMCQGLPAESLTGIETGTRVFIVRGETATSYTTVCAARPLPYPTSAVALITVGRSPDGDPPAPPASFTLHEMGHALGLVGVCLPPYPPWLDLSGQTYSGPLALEGYRREFGRVIGFLPITGAHWQGFEDVMSTERSTIKVTRVSVGALMDLGYPAAWYGADTR